jgi:hypothetical protein
VIDLLFEIKDLIGGYLAKVTDHGRTIYYIN